MKVIIIGSGSKGNSTIIKSNDDCIMIDAGITLKQIKERLKAVNEEDQKVLGIMITHEHSDHIANLRVVSNALACPIYMTNKTAKYVTNHQEIKQNIVNIEPKLSFQIGEFTIKPIRLFHDAIDPVGFIITSGDKKIVYITDTGYVHSSYFEAIRNADMYILEANHDPLMLMNCETRPYELKRRILGDNGHLSNQDAAALIGYVAGDKTKTICFAHISEECNTIELIKNTACEVLSEFNLRYDDFKIEYAKQNEALIFEV